MIVVVDLGLGNLGSIANMLRKIGAEAVISSSEEEIDRASKLILPGVGAFDPAIEGLEERGLRPVLDEMAIDKKIPTLGICLGMQLLVSGSEEGKRPGLGWIPGRAIRFESGERRGELRVPHMGWNSVHPARDHALFDGLESPRFYFVHSYHVVCENSDHVLGRTPYGTDFVSAIQKGNIMGTQFHPEKSHRFGMALLANFAQRVDGA